MQALAGRAGAIVVLDPTTGAVKAMYSNPTFDPNPLAANDTTTVSNGLHGDQHQGPDHRLRPGGVARLPGHLPARVDVQGRDGTRRLRARSPRWSTRPMPSLQLHPPRHPRGPDAPPLCNYGAPSAAAPSPLMLPALVRHRVTPCSAPRSALPGCRPRPTSFGFNQQPPLDLPHSAFQVSQFLQPTVSREPRSSWPIRRSARTARSPARCRWPWWRPPSPTAGVVMTPHVVYQIRDSQGNLVEHLPAHRLASRPRRRRDGRRGDQLMQKVVKCGTALGCRVPAPGRRGGQDRHRPGRPGQHRHHRLDDRLRPRQPPEGGGRRGHPQPAAVRHRRARSPGPIVKTMIQAALAATVTAPFRRLANGGGDRAVSGPGRQSGET